MGAIINDWPRGSQGMAPYVPGAPGFSLPMAPVATLNSSPAPRGCLFPMCHDKGQSPNQYDACLARDAAIWYNLGCMGGVKTLCRPVHAVRYSEDDPPWISIPPQGRRLQEIATAALGTFVLNTDKVVLTYQVPVGYDGVITGNVHRFLGLGFVEGSGDIEWRIQLSRRYAPDYGLMLTSIGDLTNPASFSGGGIRIYSCQTINYIARVTNFATLDPNGRILTSFNGWIYPRS